MAKFLETQAISNELMKLIKDAKDKIILVSPYLKVNSQIQERLKTKSKIGTLSEIVIVYGKSELKKTELEWIKQIEDLKVIEKNNLHAKCYINEEKAIVCSMNLYDYSQQNNIEMGILITKKEDEEAYNSLIDEINNIKVNGVRKKFDLLNTIEDPSKIASEINNTFEKKETKEAPIKQFELTPEQKLKFQVLKEWRLYKSRTEKTSAFLVLTDAEIKSIVTTENLDKKSIYDIIPTKTAIKYSEEILNKIKYTSDYTIAKVVNISYQDNYNSYDRVKLKLLSTGEEKWFDTTYELPYKDKIVAAKINKTWFNDYLYLDN
jgi:hypothetical protein